jgi:hypothetical protein
MPQRRENTRICLIGAPGTGKSTLAQALVAKMKLQGLDVEFCPEYARTYFRQTGAPKNVFEQFVIFAGQCEREDELDVHDYVVADSASFMSDTFYSYMRFKQGKMGPDPKLDRAYAELQRLCVPRLKSFDHIFFIPCGHFDAGKDPTREYVSDQRILDRMMRGYLDYNLADYHVVGAVGLDQRLAEVMRVLADRGAIPSATAEGDGLPPTAVDHA